MKRVLALFLALGYIITCFLAILIGIVFVYGFGFVCVTLSMLHLEVVLRTQPDSYGAIGLACCGVIVAFLLGYGILFKVRQFLLSIWNDVPCTVNELLKWHENE